ncbi:MAG TPA: hypothetical protein VJM83_01400 [Nitrospirota bacterium]|nr:hypothetical protein [Nitrospirota bacterium]
MSDKLIYAVPSLILFFVGFILLIPGAKKNWEHSVFKREVKYSEREEKMYKLGMLLCAVGLVSLILINYLFLK